MTEVRLFATCLAEEFYPSVIDAAALVLERLKLRVRPMRGAFCCAQAPFNEGLRDSAVDLARLFLKACEPGTPVVVVWLPGTPVEVVLAPGTPVVVRALPGTPVLCAKAGLAIASSAQKVAALNNVIMISSPLLPGFQTTEIRCSSHRIPALLE